MQENRAVISNNVAPMRAEPGTTGEQTSQALFGETVAVLEGADGFSRVRTPDGYEGWVRDAHLMVLEPGTHYPDPLRAALVSDLYLPLFTAPSARSERVTVLTIGTVVEIGGAEAIEGFYPLRLPGGRVCYADGSALIIPQYPSAEGIGPNLAMVARAFIGVPYLWGGRSAFGLDCSGFTQRVYALNGVFIPRDAYQQAESPLFEPSPANDTRPGDLLFFGGGDHPHGRKITHVGMALGDGRFIHASGALGVAATPLDEEPFASQLIAAARLRHKQAIDNRETGAL